MKSSFEIVYFSEKFKRIPEKTLTNIRKKFISATCFRNFCVNYKFSGALEVIPVAAALLESQKIGKGGCICRNPETP